MGLCHNWLDPSPLTLCTFMFIYKVNHVLDSGGIDWDKSPTFSADRFRWLPLFNVNWTYKSADTWNNSRTEKKVQDRQCHCWRGMGGGALAEEEREKSVGIYSL